MNATVLLTGSSGMIGKGVGKILLINRRPLGITHAKIEEFILPEFMDIDKLKDAIGSVDACFHCMGVSALGLSEEKYTLLTLDITKKLADLVYDANPQAVFNYVSGVGTDSTETGTQMWARVKGKAENYLLQKGFKKAFMFRPGLIIPEKGIQSRTSWYNAIYKITRPFFPLFLKSANVTTTTKIGQAMIHTLSTSLSSGILDPRQINLLAGTNQ